MPAPRTHSVGSLGASVMPCTAPLIPDQVLVSIVPSGRVTCADIPKSRSIYRSAPSLGNDTLRPSGNVTLDASPFQCRRSDGDKGSSPSTITVALPVKYAVSPNQQPFGLRKLTDPWKDLRVANSRLASVNTGTSIRERNTPAGKRKTICEPDRKARLNRRYTSATSPLSRR